MARVLIVYASKSGQTRKIAILLGSELRHLGNSVDLFDAARRANEPTVSSFDAVVVGAPVYRSRFPVRIRSWVKKSLPTLSNRPGAFFSVCLGILEKRDTGTHEAEHEIVEEFFQETGWHPRLWTTFPGAILYTKYSWLLRRIMKRVARKAGGGTDTGRDYEYTDWEQVRRFAREFSENLRGRPRRVG